METITVSAMQFRQFPAGAAGTDGVQAKLPPTSSVASKNCKYDRKTYQKKWPELMQKWPELMQKNKKNKRIAKLKLANVLGEIAVDKHTYLVEKKSTLYM